VVWRWRADPAKAAAIDGRMGRNSIHRKSTAKTGCVNATFLPVCTERRRHAFVYTPLQSSLRDRERAPGG
jgi:hypothetical protein